MTAQQIISTSGFVSAPRHSIVRTSCSAGRGGGRAEKGAGMTKTKLVKFSLARFISAECFGGLSVFGGGGLPPRGSDGSYVGFSGDDFNSARRALEAPVLTAGVHLTADILVQMGMEGRDLFSWDIWRSLRLALFGLLIKGPLIGLFYRRVDHVFPKRVFSHTVSKMLCDLGPFSWFINSCFLFWIPVVEGHGVQKACDTVISGIIPMQINAYKVWPAVHTVNYMFVPPSARILFVHCANLIWQYEANLWFSKLKYAYSVAPRTN